MAEVDAEVLAGYTSVFSDGSEQTWVVVAASKAGKLSLQARGTGGLDEAAACFEDEKVQFAFVRLARTDDGGDSKRVKFVLLSWVGERAAVLLKGRSGSLKAELLGRFRGTHVSHALTDRSQLATLAGDVDDALRRAGGANYDLGNAAAGVSAGNAGGLKKASAAFFAQKDAETEVKGAVFATHLRKGRDIAPCDLGNRSMTASATESKRNTVGYDAAAAGGGGGEGEGEGAAEGAAAAAAAAADRRKGQEA